MTREIRHKLVNGIIEDYKQEPAYYHSVDWLRCLLERHLMVSDVVRPTRNELKQLYKKWDYMMVKSVLVQNSRWCIRCWKFLSLQEKWYIICDRCFKKLESS